MGPQEDYIETVVTCEGNFHDPQLEDRLRNFQQRLESLLLEDGKKQLILKKVEPWNSVRVTFSIPTQAALRLRQLAEQGNACLRQMGVLGVQIQGDRLVSLTVATANNQRAELIISTHEKPGQDAALDTRQGAPGGPSFDPCLPSSSEEQGSPGPSMEVTRKNIEEYLRQGALLKPGLPSSSASGPLVSDPSHDIFKTAPSAEGGLFHINNVAVSELQASSSVPSFPERPVFVGSDGHGVNVPVPGPHSSRMSPAQHVAHHQPQKYNMVPQKQHFQQHMSQATSLPQTAALGYNAMGLPPPPPYPHGHTAGVANNVSRQGKRLPASSPLLINLLQTEPLAGSGSEEKVKKKRRRRKDKQVSTTSTFDGQSSSQGIPTLPLDSETPSFVPPITTPSQEEMSAVLHRQVSPVPLPSPILSTGFGSSLPITSVHSENLGRDASTASAALASLAQSQRSVVVSEHFTGDTIINPYTGHMEPRDSASDLSPVKKDQHKSQTTIAESIGNGTAVSVAGLHPQASVATAKAVVRTGTSDSVHIGFGSFQSGATVPSSLREERSRAFPSSTMTSISLSEHVHSTASDIVFGQHSNVSYSRVSTASTVPTIVSSHIYAQHPSGLSQPPSQAPHSSQQHSSHPAAGIPSVNGPVSVPLPSSSHAVPPDRPSAERLQTPQGTLQSGSVDPYHPSSCRPGHLAQGDVVHNVSVGMDVKGPSVDGQLTSDAGNQQSVSGLDIQTVTSTAVSIVETQAGTVPASTVAAQVQSDSLKLLNSSSSTAVVVTQSMEVDSATTAVSSNSPADIKPSSDGEDYSNQSGVSPVSTVASAPSSLLDANGTKVDNHDSGMGSSSERSDDTTPSEAGDGEFQTSIGPAEPSATESSAGKPAVVKTAVVNCKKAGTESSEPHTITVGYVQMNQHHADLYNKETKKFLTDSPPLIGDKAFTQGSLQEMSNPIKSVTSLTSVADQVTLDIHKDIHKEGVPLSLSAKTHCLQEEQATVTHKVNNQVSERHLNGPTTLLPGYHPPGTPSLHSPNNRHPTLRHSSILSTAPNEEEQHMPAPISNNQASQPVSGGMMISQGQAGQQHQGSSLPSSHAGGHQTSPVPVPTQPDHIASDPEAGPVWQQAADPSQAPPSGTGDAGSSSSPVAHNSQSASEPSSVFVEACMSRISSAVTQNQAHKGVTPSVDPLTGHPSGNVPKLPPQLQIMVSLAQGIDTVNTAITQRDSTSHKLGVPSPTVYTVASPGPPASNSPEPSLPTHSLALQAPISHVPVCHSTNPKSSGEKLANCSPSALVSVSSAVLENATAHVSASAHTNTMNNLAVGGTTVSSDLDVGNRSPTVGAELETPGQVPASNAVSDGKNSEDSMQSDSVKVTRSSPMSINLKNPATDLDIMSMASEAMKDMPVLDLALMDTQGDDAVFDSEEDLALLTEPGLSLSAYLDVGIHHSAANGSVGVSAEARVGSNITSIYAKRSSPINVNMLNHIYAAGLPQPRRLTESVQRVVKPLPNPENSLLPGRTCKSPSASSRHSSNGSTPPGRGGQGGARSPGGIISTASSTRSLALDKLTASLSSIVHCSLGSASSTNSLSSHTPHPAYGGGINCVTTSAITTAPHPLASLQSPGSVRHKSGNGSVVPSSVSVTVSASLSTSCTSSVPTPSLSVLSSSASLSSLSASVTIVPHTVVDIPSSPHLLGSTAVVPHDLPSKLQMDLHGQSVSGPLCKPHASQAVCAHRPHTPPISSNPGQPAVVQQKPAQPDRGVCRVSGPAVLPRLPLPGGGVSVVSNHVPVRKLPRHSVPPDPCAVTISVCNTPRSDHVTNRTGTLSSIVPSLSSSTSLSSSVHHSPPVSLPSPVVCSALSASQQFQHFSSSASVPLTQTSNSSVTVVPSSIDLSSHAAVAAVEQDCHANPAPTSQCVSNALAASTPAGSSVNPRLLTVTTSHPVTSESPQGLPLSAGLALSDRGACVNTDRLVSSGSELTESEQRLASAEKHTLVDYSRSGSQSLCSGRTLTHPSTERVKGHAMVHISSARGGHQSPRPSVQNSNTALGDSVMPNAQSVLETSSDAPRLKANNGEEVKEVDASVAPFPPSQLCTQDSSQSVPHCPAENPHSKPPLLQPTPPLTLPTLIPSATPPPPPLTPVLPQDMLKREAASFLNHQLPAGEGLDEGTAASIREMSGTTSPSLMVNPYAVSEKVDSISVDGMNCTMSTEGIHNTASNHPVCNEASDSAVHLSLPVSDPVSACSSSEDGSLKTRRLTRKRKSTNSESDSSTEPAPKLSSVESVPETGNKTENKSSSSPDPPKLPKDGKKSQGIDKKEDEKTSKVAKDDDKEKGKKEEEKAGSKNMVHHDRNVIDATPEEVARKIAAAGNKRRYYTYVLEHATPGQSYFDTPVLTGRTRSQGTRGGPKENTVVSAAGSVPGPGGGSQPVVAGSKEEGGDTAAPGSKRSTRSLRPKDAADSSQTKRKRSKEHR